MVGGEDHFAILEAPKHLFLHFFTIFSACYSLRMLLLERRRKVEKGTFQSNLKQEGVCPVLYFHHVCCGLG